MATPSSPEGLVSIAGINLEVLRLGQGRPVLLIEGADGLERDSVLVEALARDHEVIIASPPGFGQSERPAWIDCPNDLAYFQLDVVERLGLEDVMVIGCSFGGWIAAEMAVMDDSFISRLVLIDPVGVKHGGPTDTDIADIWTLTPKQVAQRKWFDPAVGERDYPAMPEDELAVIARNSESLARFCWQPYMHNPKLRHRLHRIGCPTLLVWGAADGIVTPQYGRDYAALIPNARFVEIEKAGHLPHIEQPDAVHKAIAAFNASSSSR